MSKVRTQEGMVRFCMLEEKRRDPNLPPPAEITLSEGRSEIEVVG